MPFSFNPLLGVGLDKSIPLDGAGKIPSTFLPSYVDDVEEYNNLAAFPATGETGKIYVAIDTGFVYRWSGSVYVQIGITAAAGSTTQVQFNDGGAFGGDAGLVFDKTTDALTIAGPVVHPLGAAATPSLTFTGDPNTGIYSPGADQLAISTNGTGRLFIDANGNSYLDSPGKFGVGQFPLTTLHLGPTPAAAGSIGIIGFGRISTSHICASIEGTRDAASFASSLIFRTQDAGGTATAGLERLRITSTGALNFVGAGTAGSTQAVSFNGSAPVNSLVIDSSGRLGLGTSSPEEILDVNGAIRLAGTSSLSSVLISKNVDQPSGSRYLLLCKNSSQQSCQGTIVGKRSSGSSVGRNSSEFSFFVRGSSGTPSISWSVNNFTYDVKLVTLDYDDGTGVASWVAIDAVNTGATTRPLQGALFTGIKDSASLTWVTEASISNPQARLSDTTFVHGGHFAIDGSGKVGIGTTSPGAPLTIESNAGNQVKITYPSIVSYFLNATSGGDFAINKDGTERARIDSSGRLLVGTSSARSNFFNTTISSQFLIEGANDATIGRNSAFVYGATNSAGPLITLAKHRSNSIGGTTVVSSGDKLGGISWQGSDGTEFVEGASIVAEVDGTPGANDMPGRLVFSTTSDGAATTTERLRITSAGVLQIADAGNITVGTTTGTKIGTATTQKLGFYNATPVVQPAAVADATTAVDVITQLNDLLAKLRTLGIIAT